MCTPCRNSRFRSARRCHCRRLCLTLIARTQKQRGRRCIRVREDALRRRAWMFFPWKHRLDLFLVRTGMGTLWRVSCHVAIMTLLDERVWDDRRRRRLEKATGVGRRGARVGLVIFSGWGGVPDVFKVGIDGKRVWRGWNVGWWFDRWVPRYHGG